MLQQELEQEQTSISCLQTKYDAERVSVWFAELAQKELRPFSREFCGGAERIRPVADIPCLGWVFALTSLLWFFQNKWLKKTERELSNLHLSWKPLLKRRWLALWGRWWWCIRWQRCPWYYKPQSPEMVFSKKLDCCIVWNAHNTVFGSKRLAVCAQAVYFLSSTMLIVMWLRLSDVSIICHVAFLQFPILACFSSTSVSQAAQQH